MSPLLAAGKVVMGYHSLHELVPMLRHGGCLPQLGLIRAQPLPVQNLHFSAMCEQIV